MPAVKQLRQSMTQYVGILRHKEGLEKAIDLFQHYETLSQNSYPLFNMAQCALMIAISAHKRQESRGAHFRTDFPNEKQNPKSIFWTLKEMKSYIKNTPHTHLPKTQKPILHKFPYLADK